MSAEPTWEIVMRMREGARRLYALEGYAEGDFAKFYRNVTKDMLAQWLCDALRGDKPVHLHCLKWWEIHQQHEKR